MTFYDDLACRGAAVALREGEETLGYAALAQAADAMGENLPPRSLVFCVCENSMAPIVGYLGCLRRRAVVVMVNEALDTALFAALVDAYRPGYIWCPAGFAQGESIYEARGYVLLRTGAAAPPMAEDLAVLLTTSGSTGSPKLVRQTYKNIDANTESIAQYLGILPEDRAITTLPLSYTFGLSILQSHLYAGAELVLTKYGILQKEFWAALKESGATTFGGVPYTYEMLKRLRFLRMELPALRYVTQAGGRLGPELHLEFAQGLRAAGKALIVMYGATEATARMSYVPADKAVEKAGSIGIAIPGGRFELIDDDGGVLDGPDVVGELVYYGDNVTPGYAECRDDLALGDERQGRLLTGDMAKRDADGYYYVVGRKKRFLKLYGNRVNLVEVEALLAKAGYEAACTGSDDHLRVYTTHEDTAGALALLCSTMNINRAAFTVTHIEAIPRNDAGKVLYAALEKE